MNRDETIALFLKGREVWNAWAERMTGERKRLDELGLWLDERNSNGELKPKNSETKVWMEAAEVDFSECLFVVKVPDATEDTHKEATGSIDASAPSAHRILIDGTKIDFLDFVFPWGASFRRAIFSGRTLFSCSIFSGPTSFTHAVFSKQADFRTAKFASDTFFVEAKFLQSARFGDAAFSTNTSFARSRFSGTAGFENTLFSSSVKFESANFLFGEFNHTQFLGDAEFEHVIFLGPSSFSNATFARNASFGSTTFSRDASFDSTIFSGDAAFYRTTFSDRAWFGRADFKGTALFGSATFLGGAWFDSATFKGYTRFDNATFSKSTSFRHARFGSEKNMNAEFSAIKAERAFDLMGARFSKVPNFCQADFKQAPDLDGVDFPLPSPEPAVIGDPDLIPKYRALRRMAIQGADYESEHKAFKGELRSRRWCIDKWWHPSAWLGVLYDGIADCGRSITQPALAWAITLIVFAAFYWGRAFEGAEARCADPGGALVQALYLSVKNWLVLFAGTRDARVNQAYVCLYGGTPEQPQIPPAVTFAETMLQFPISAILIFLVLLAVKNRFKIK